MSCTNQLFFFCGEFKTKIVHNVFHMNKQDFQIERSIRQFRNSWETVENLIETSKDKPIEDYDLPVMYWKSSGGTQGHVQKMFEQHFKRNESNDVIEYNPPKSLWDVCMNITQVSTHQIDSFNVGFDTSVRGGNFLCKNAQIKPHEYVLGLGYYMRAFQNTGAWEGVNLKPLQEKVIAIVKPREEAPPHTIQIS